MEKNSKRIKIRMKQCSEEHGQIMLSMTKYYLLKLLIKFDNTAYAISLRFKTIILCIIGIQCEVLRRFSWNSLENDSSSIFVGFLLLLLMLRFQIKRYQS